MEGKRLKIDWIQSVLRLILQKSIPDHRHQLRFPRSFSCSHWRELWWKKVQLLVKIINSALHHVQNLIYMLPLADREKRALAMHVAQRQFFGKINHCWRFSMFSMQSTTVSQCPAKVFSELLQHPKLSTVIISPKIINYYHIAHNDQLLSYHPKLSVIIISPKMINYYQLSPIILSLSTGGFFSVIQFNFAYLLPSIDFKTLDKRFLKISLKLNLNLRK